MKKAFLVAAAVLILTAGLLTAEEKKEAAPAVSVELRQQVEAGYVDGKPGKTLLLNEDILYSRTEVSSKAAFDLAKGFTLSP